MSLSKPPNLRGSTSALEITDLSFTYEGSNRAALSDIHLDIAPGEFIIIAGPSGSGKSTLARCLTGFIPHEYKGTFNGSVKIHGQDTLTFPIHNIARKVSLIQQDPDSQLVTLNVINETAFGPENFEFPPEEIYNRIEWALKAVTASHLQPRSTHTLSGGEKQKIIIASFLTIQAPILIFDEPTARLDPPTTQELVNTLQELNQNGATILIIEHRIQPFLPLASRIILLKEGRIHFDGAYTQLEETPSILMELGVALHPMVFTPPLLEKASDALVEAVLEVTGLTYSYPQVEELTPAQPAIKDITFSLHPGETVALMGANGSGKSTLLLHLMGLLHPDRGTIRLSGQNIHNQAVSNLAKHVGYVFQNPLHQLFAQTIREEVLLASEHLKTPEPKKANARADELLEIMGLSEYQDQSPFSLSLGEQRRLTIASILLHQPTLLLLDEPFIGQDYRNVHRIMTTLQLAVKNGAAILLATHDPSIAETYCNRLLFLHSGRILIDAPVQQGLNYLNTLGVSAYSIIRNLQEVSQTI